MTELGDLIFDEIGKLFGEPVIEPTENGWYDDGLITEFLFVDVNDFFCFGGGFLLKEEIMVEFDDFESKFFLVLNV